MPTASMVRLILLCVCLSASVSNIIAQEKQSTGRLLETNVTAPSLKGNLLGDPEEQSVLVYLPPSYDTAPGKRYPTLYLLHGFLGRSRGWNTGIYQGLRLQPFMDEMIKSGKIGEVIVVAPNGWNAYGGAFYSNSTVAGDWGDYIVKDLVGNVDANYRTIAEPESRGIGGHSMGGFGAISLGMKHPEVFGAVYALAPCCLAFEADMSEANPVWEKVLNLKSKDEIKLRPESLEDFYSLVFVALSAAFSPDPKAGPFMVNFPFRAGNCPTPTEPPKPCFERNQPAYDKWRERIPLYMVEANEGNLRKLRGLFIDYGEKEEFPHIVLGGRLFSQALAQRNIPHIFEVYERGNHSDMIRQRIETRLVQFFAEKLNFTEVK